MIRLIITISIVTALTNCNLSNKKTTKIEEQKNETANTVSANDTTPKVTGIGGVFFYSDNLPKTKEWYIKNLGIEFNDWGSSSFESRNINNPDEINTLQWCPFKKESEHFAPSKKEIIIFPHPKKIL